MRLRGFLYLIFGAFLLALMLWSFIPSGPYSISTFLPFGWMPGTVGIIFVWAGFEALRRNLRKQPLISP